MATARLPVILVLYLLQATVQGQQHNGLSGQSKSNVVLTNSPAVSDPRVADLISSAKNSQNLCGNKGAGLTIQQNTKQTPATGLQQLLNLQKPTNPSVNLQLLPLSVQPSPGNQNLQQALNLQQPLNVQQCSNQNLQQQLIAQQCINQNIQQPVNVQQCTQQNLQQPLNVQQYTNQNLQPQLNIQPTTTVSQQQSVNQQPCSNLQQIPLEILQQSQNQQQPVSLQQLILQQQSYLAVPNDLQILGNQAPTQSELCLSLLPVINGQIQGLPSQVSQEVLLSNLGLSSNLPSLLSNSCIEPTADQLNLIYSQNDVPLHSTLPLPTADGPQTGNSLPLSLSPAYFPAERPSNSLNRMTSFVIPVGLQDSAAYQPNQAIDCGLNQMSVVPKNQYQTNPNHIALQNAQTQSCQPQTVPVQQVASQSIQSQPFQPTPVQTNPVQNVPIQTAYTVQSQPAQNSIPNQQSLTSLLLSQIQPSNNPSQYPNSLSYPSSTNSGSKSSSMKALLPLLYNLLKEKNGGCGCPNCNYGCMNNMPDCGGRYPCMNSNFNNEQEQQQVRNVISSNNNNERDDDQDVRVVNDNRKDPEITKGYSNQKKYSQDNDKEKIINCVESDEKEAKKVPEKKYQNYKKKKESVEEYDGDDDYGDSYEDDD